MIYSITSSKSQSGAQFSALYSSAIFNNINPAHVAVGQSLPSHDGLKSCDVRCWSDSCQKIAGPRMQRSVFAAAKQPRHSIKSPT